MDDQHLTFRITPQTRQAAIQAAMRCPEGFVIELRPEKRTDIQSQRLHAMCGDFSKQLQWAGAWRTKVDWKRLLVDASSRASGDGGYTVAPSLDFSGVVTMGELTRDMGIKRMSTVIEYAFAYGAEKNIRWSEKIDVPAWYREKVAA